MIPRHCDSLSVRAARWPFRLLGLALVLGGLGCQGGGQIDNGGSGNGGAGNGGGGNGSGGGIVINTSGQGGNKGPTSVNTKNCGDGVLDTANGEACDDGNTEGGDGCNKLCQLEANFLCKEPGQPCENLAKCGNGVLTSNETCDDGNTDDGDGCSSDCMNVEDGYQCRVPGKRCTPLCGDGKLTGTEACDDGNDKSDDGCSSTCQIEPGADCPTPGQACKMAVCGNGVVEKSELCDCGTDPTNLPSGCNSVNGLFYGDGKGCSKTCTKEPTCQDSSGKTQACTASCGDGNLDPGEDCDDGDLVGWRWVFVQVQSRGWLQLLDRHQAGLLDVPVGFRRVPRAARHLPRLPARECRLWGASGLPIPRYAATTTRRRPRPFAFPTRAGCPRAMTRPRAAWGIVAPDLLKGKPQPGPTTTCDCQFSDWNIGNSDRIQGNYTQAANDSPLSNGAGDYPGRSCRHCRQHDEHGRRLQRHPDWLHRKHPGRSNLEGQGACLQGRRPASSNGSTTTPR